MSPVIESLPILVLDVFSRCNCRCVMCDIWQRDSVRRIDADDLGRQLPDIVKLGVKRVVLTGGEPLMHPRLFSLTAPLKQSEIRITLLTTGLLLSRFAREIVSEIDDVIVSLDGPAAVHDRIRRVTGAFSRLKQGISDLRRIEPGYPVTARSTVQRSNAACLEDTVSAARELGCDSISFLAVDAASTAFNRANGISAERQAELIPGPNEITALSEAIRRLIRQGECGGFVAESPEKLRRIVDRFRWAQGIGVPVAPPCNAPWVSAVVESDGAVRPCFFHPPIGYLRPGSTLEQVVNGPEAIVFRSRLDIAENPICRSCVCSLDWKGAEVR